MDANLCWQTSGNLCGAAVVCEEVSTVSDGYNLQASGSCCEIVYKICGP